MTSLWIYPPKPPRRGRWATREALVAHLDEDHGYAADEPPGPHFDALFPSYVWERPDMPLLRRMHAAMHDPDARPSHDH